MSEDSLSRRLGLGRLALTVWHQPVGRLRQLIRNGGPWAERQTISGRLDMERAAHALPPLPVAPENTPLCFHLLTGRRFWYQTAFCLHSLARSAGEPIRAEIYDDGTIDAEVAGWLQRLGPSLKIHSQKEIIARLDAHLPAARFPVLRERWSNYPNIRKLTDIHVGRSGWKLVIDSDLLFFRRPELLLNWLNSPQTPLHAVDCTESYGYSRPLMESLAGARLADRVNVGLCGLNGGEIDWAQLEAWCAELIARERTNYYLEQAVVAMLVAARSCVVAPEHEYLTLPNRAEALSPTAVMHHFVAESKRWYFTESWKKVLRP